MQYFDPEVLEEISGTTIFKRGERYFRDGQVELLALENGKAFARVRGSEIYRTSVIAEDEDLDGSCTCPAFEDWDFCKHMVAVALAANAAAAKGEESGLWSWSGLRSYLDACSHASLVDMLMKLAEEDSDVFRRLETLSVTSPNPDPDAEARFRDRIALALDAFEDLDGFWGDGEMLDEDLSELRSLADALDDWVAAGQAEAACRLSAYLMDRLAERSDELPWDYSSLLRQAAGTHLSACRLAPPDPVELAADIFHREMEGGYEGLRGYEDLSCAAEFYADLLDGAGLQEYRRLAEGAWRTLPAMPPLRGDEVAVYAPELELSLQRLLPVMDYLARLDSDVDKRIAIRTRNLSSPWNYLHLVNFCLDQDREREALFYLEEGLWVFADSRPNRHFLSEASDLLERLGYRERACEIVANCFRKMPDSELYEQLARLGGKEACAAAVASLEAELENRNGFERSRAADLLVAILVGQEQLERAWGIATSNKISAERRLQLAGASEQAHPDRARAVYEQEVERLVEQGGNASYKEACDLISRLPGLQSARYHEEYLEALKSRFRRKRNFMKLLEQGA